MNNWVCLNAIATIISLRVYNSGDRRTSTMIVIFKTEQWIQKWMRSIYITPSYALSSKFTQVTNSELHKPIAFQKMNLAARRRAKLVVYSVLWGRYTVHLLNTLDKYLEELSGSSNIPFFYFFHCQIMKFLSSPESVISLQIKNTNTISKINKYGEMPIDIVQKN